MRSVFGILSKFGDSKPEYKVLIVGVDNAGKTVSGFYLVEFIRSNKKIWRQGFITNSKYYTN